MTFLYANRLKLCMRIDLMSAIWIVGETTSMYANRPRSCRRNDLGVCKSTCMRIDLYANQLVCESTCMRNDREPQYSLKCLWNEFFDPFLLQKMKWQAPLIHIFPIWVILKSVIYWFPCLEVGHFELQMCDFQRMAKTCKLDLPTS